MAIELGTKVVMNNAGGYGILPNDIGMYSTIVGYVESTSEKYFKKGAYYLNPPIGNNKQREMRQEGWGIDNRSFAISGGKEKLILAGTYFVIVSYGNCESMFKDLYALNTVYRQDYDHPSIAPTNPRSAVKASPCYHFGYSDLAKESNTRVRYATPIEMYMYEKLQAPIYIGNLPKSMFKFVPIGHHSFWDGVATTDLSSTIGMSTGVISGNTAYISDVGKRPNFPHMDISDLVLGSDLLVGSSGNISWPTIPETKETRLQKLTEGIIMQKPILIPTIKKKIKKLI